PEAVAGGEAFAVTCGWVRPRILVSTGLAAALTAAEIGAVLAHEREHLRHRDPLRLLAARLVAAWGCYLPAARWSGPEHEALLADSVGLALLVVLDTLAPAERLAFVLHDMFAVPFDQIAAIVGRSPNAARLLASRARHRVQGAAPLPDA